jgi:DNA adenine methylase
MQYFGGKSRLSKRIAEYLESVRKDNQPYFEPFVGGANVVTKMSGKRYASDNNQYLIKLYQLVRDNTIELPDTISEDEYKYYKNLDAILDYDMAMKAFVGVGCSFGGKWFGGYARSNKGQDYCSKAKISLVKARLDDISFKHISYIDCNPKNMLIYCDPPYQKATNGYLHKEFSNELFWETMREWSQCNDVYISEYNAPDDFEMITFFQHLLRVRAKKGCAARIEGLFKLKEKV